VIAMVHPIPEGARIRYRDILTFPQSVTGERIELYEGEFVMVPAPGFWHQNTVANLFFHISRYVREHNLGKIIPAPCDVYFDEYTVLEPDLLFISKERLHIAGPRLVRGSPDWVAEVLSQTTEERDRGFKLRWYALQGVREYWIVDPDRRVVEVYIKKGQVYQLLGEFSGEEMIRSEAFTKLELKVDQLWE